MKLFLASLLATALGVAGYASMRGASATDECDVSVECTGEGTCVITCTRDDGGWCEIELGCDGDECVVLDRGECPGRDERCDEPCAPACR